MLKGTIPSVLLFFKNINQSLPPLEQIFIVKPQGLHVILGEIRPRVYTYYVIPC